MIFEFPMPAYGNKMGAFKCIQSPASNGCILSYSQWEEGEDPLFAKNSGVVLDSDSLLTFLLAEGDVSLKDYETKTFGAMDKSSEMSFIMFGDWVNIKGKDPRYKVEGKWVEGFSWTFSMDLTKYNDMRQRLAKDLINYLSFICVGNKDKKEVKRLTKNIDKLRAKYNESL